MSRSDGMVSGPGYKYISGLGELIAEIPADTIISRTFHDGDGVKGILFGFAPGQELSEHTAARPAILHFLAGQAQVTLGDDGFEAQAGTWVHMPAHLPHSIVARTQVIMLLLILP